MTTLCRRAFVSISVTVTFALGACVSASSRPVPDRPISRGANLLSIHFDNLSRQAVDVYLIGTKREWMLGRVAPGGVANLRLPDEAFEGRSMTVRLAVLAGERESFAAARDPRAVFSITEPASAVLSQRWSFSEGNLVSLPY
jgi:hypothetical protein